MLALTGAAVWLASRELQGIALADVLASLAATPLATVVLAVGLTAISFSAIAGYDLIAVRSMGVAVPAGPALWSGFVASSFGQVLGLGAIVGAAMRWRMLRRFGVTPLQAGLVSGAVTAGFMFSLIGIGSAVTLYAPGSISFPGSADPALIRTCAVIGLTTFLWFLLMCWVQPRLEVAGRRLRLPRFGAMLRLVVLCVIDVVPAAAVLWVLLPAGQDISLATLIPLYLAALFVGLVANVPGGVGILELACLLTFPHLPQSEVLASVLLYRAIFYVLPFLVASVVVARHEAAMAGMIAPLTPDRRRFRRGPDVLAVPEGGTPPQVAQILAGCERAEAFLAQAGDKLVLMSPDRRAFLIYASTGNALVALGDPVGPRSAWPVLIDRFLGKARAQYARPVFYKVSSEAAPMLAAAGCMVVRCGETAILDPATFTLETPARRELRRKLSRAARAGVTVIAHAPGTAPTHRLDAVHAEWLAEHGTELGFSQGRFGGALFESCRVFEARVAGSSVGFLSILRSGDGGEDAVDVMRLTGDAPDGTMHGLVVAALDAARADGVRRFSLCAVSLSGIDDPDGRVERVENAIFRRFGDRAGLTGLRRFKAAFRPEWEPVHAAFRPPLILPVTEALSVWRVLRQPKRSTTAAEALAAAPIHAGGSARRRKIGAWRGRKPALRRREPPALPPCSVLSAAMPAASGPISEPAGSAAER